jgi:hypothetical protein
MGSWVGTIREVRLAPLPLDEERAGEGRRRAANLTGDVPVVGLLGLLALTLTLPALVLFLPLVLLLTRAVACVLRRCGRRGGSAEPSRISKTQSQGRVVSCADEV